MSSVPSPATYGQRDRDTYEPEPRRPEEGKGAAGTGPCTGVPSRAFPPRGQEQLPKGKARSAQPLPSKPCQPLEEPAPAYQNTPPPVLPARVRQAGGDGEQGWGAVVLPTTGERLAAESGKVALGNPSMMRREGIFFGGGHAQKPHERPRGMLTEKTRKVKVASTPFGLKVNPRGPTTP